MAIGHPRRGPKFCLVMDCGLGRSREGLSGGRQRGHKDKAKKTHASEKALAHYKPPIWLYPRKSPVAMPWRAWAGYILKNSSPEMKTRELARSILTDLHFWLPAAVLALGAGLLFLIARA